MNEPVARRTSSMNVWRTNSDAMIATHEPWMMARCVDSPRTTRRRTTRMWKGRIQVSRQRVAPRDISWNTRMRRASKRVRSAFWVPALRHGSGCISKAPFQQIPCLGASPGSSNASATICPQGGVRMPTGAGATYAAGAGESPRRPPPGRTRRAEARATGCPPPPHGRRYSPPMRLTSGRRSGSRGHSCS